MKPSKSNLHATPRAVKQPIRLPPERAHDTSITRDVDCQQALAIFYASSCFASFNPSADACLKNDAASSLRPSSRAITPRLKHASAFPEDAADLNHLIKSAFSK
jgi:hypothetical protein